MSKYYPLIFFFCITTSGLYCQGVMWESLGYSDDQPIPRSYSMNVGTNIISVNWTTFSDGGTFAPHDSYSDYVFFDADIFGGQTGNMGMGFNNSSDDDDDYIQVVFNFSEGVNDLTFTLLDLDQASWDDGVEVIINGSINVTADPAHYTIVNSLYVSLDNEAGWNGFESENAPSSVANADTDGNVTIHINNTTVNSVSVRYFSTNDLPRRANPDAQRMGISDMSWTGSLACQTAFTNPHVMYYRRID